MKKNAYKQKMMIQNKRNKKIKQKKLMKRITSIATAAVMLSVSLPMSEIKDGCGVLSNFMQSITVHAFNSEESNVIGISSFQQLIDYSNNYDATHANDTIKITFGDSGTSGELTGFTPIGTVGAPFDGKIVIGSGMTLNLPTTMFSYITDDVQIVDTSDNNAALIITRTRVTQDEPLFAENVVHNSSSTGADWSIHYNRYHNPDNNSYYAYDFAGIIGTMESGAKVKFSTLTLDNLGGNGAADISSTGDSGLVCRTMNEGAILEVDEITQTAENSSSAFDIESTGTGNVGGLVGSMSDSSMLILGEDLVNIQGANQGITAANGYAGGIVGFCNGGTIVFNNTTPYTSTQLITGSSGAGGIAGYYNTVVIGTLASDTDRYAVSTDEVSITSSCRVNGAGNCGGLFGEVNNDGDMTITGATAVSPAHVAGAASTYGALFGKYTAVALSDSLTVSTTGSNAPTRSGSVSQFGGLIGEVSGTSYVNFNGVTANTTNASATTNFGGLVGKADQGFIELTGTNTISYSGVSTDKTFAGVVGHLGDGVLYLQGTTNLSGAQAVSTASANSGQVVGYRLRGLVFAADGWAMIRSNSSQILDDIGTWGEVVRFNSSTLKLADVLTLDTTDHTVTLLPAVTSITNLTDFVKTALNMQVNNGQTTGVLRCSGSDESTLLRTNLSLSSGITIDLRGTGITGLTRDGSYGDSTTGLVLNPYTAEFDGSNSTIILATGEEYFPNTASGKTDGNGTIYRHEYNGLFGKTEGATIKNLNISELSSINVKAERAMYVGNVVAQASGGLTLNTVNICNDGTDYATINNAGSSIHVGGLVGNLTSAGTVAITACEYQGEIKGSATSSKIGGFIGSVTSSNTFGITISGANKVGGKITASSGNEVGGTIGTIAEISDRDNYSSSDRKLNLNGLTISALDMNVSDTCGGFLGQNWYETDVEFTSVKVGDGAKVTSTGNTAGLVHTATGYWKVNGSGITLGSSTSGDTMSVTSDGTNFGLLVNKGYTDDSAIYLELAPSAFTLTKSAVALTMDSVTVFDELIAYTGSGDDVLGNGKGVVSIATTDHALLKMGASDTTNTGTTYQHQTAFLDSNTALMDNPHSRYYYNLDAYRESPSAGAQQLLIWSVKQYAHESIKDYFVFNESAVGTSSSTDLNMLGYSYYPVDLTDSLTLKGAVHLYKAEFDVTETSTTDNRLTSEKAQHYLMHNGLFRNVSGSFTFNGSLNGNINKIDSYCGAIVMGTVSSDATGSPATINVDQCVLAGVKIGSSAGPLLINKAGSNAVLNITNVSNDSTSYTAMGAGATSQTYIATSLLGTIGSSDASGVKLNFSLIKLDGRNATGVTNLSSLNDIYHSKGSLFSDATLVGTLAYKDNSGSYGVYNYEYDKDWDDGNNGIPRNVTYGAEIDDTAENVDDQGNSKQQKYNKPAGATDYYTRPDLDPATSNSAYNSFGTNFQNYVATGYSTTNKTHELSVNISTSSFRGCGTYNDPYIITSGGDLENIAKLINGSFITSSFTIYVPSAITDSNKSATWCENKSSHTAYTSFTLVSGNRDSSTWSTADGNTKIKDSTLAEYLAGAYYKIDPSITTAITLTSAFEGISKNVGGAYAFRGVIEGSGKTIINQTTNPLIDNSYGSVVYNLTLDIQPSTAKALTMTNTNKSFLATGTYNDNRCEYYGAVMGQILGGDNIIDNVSVKFTGPVVNANGKTAAHLVPIGGYVGVVVNGGLIFREMTGLAKDNQAGLKATNLSGFGTGVGATPENPLAADNTKWLYVNPIIGRVLNGYAITESASFKPFEDGSRTYPDGTIEYWHVTSDGAFANTTASGKVPVTMRNGTKNYSIADISTGDTSGFNMTGIADDSDIEISTAQGLYIMSLITQNGLGKSSTGAYSQIDELKPYDSYMATHHANYRYVGNSALATGAAPTLSTASTAAQTDYANSTNDTYTGTTDKIPYIIKTYTNTLTLNEGEETEETIYPAFDVMGDADHFFDLVLKTDSATTFYLPDSYRGIGSLMLGTSFTSSTNLDNFKNNVAFLYGMSGKQNTVSENMNLTIYATDNYPVLSGDQAFFKTGFGFIDCLQSKTNADKSFSNLTIKGSVKYALIDQSTGNHVDYIKANVHTDRKNNPAVAAFIGVPVADKSSNPVGYDVKMSQISLDKMELSGIRYVGGLLGALNIKGLFSFDQCNADDLKIIAGGAAGSLIGYMRNQNARIEATDCELGIISIISAAQLSDLGGDSHAGAGGLIGNRQSSSAYQSTNLTFTNVTVRNGSSVDSGYIGYFNNDDVDSSKSNPTIPAAGGLIGYSSKSTLISANNVTVSNLNISGAYAGGMVGLLTEQNSCSNFVNCTVTTDQNCTIESEWNNEGAGSGGFIGKNDERNNSKFDTCTVENYTISGYQNVGGLIGYNSYNIDTIKVVANNIIMENNTLKGDNKVGGMVGYHQHNELDGYNILINNQSSEVYTEGGEITNNGYIVGSIGSNNIKIAGFSRQGTIDTAAMVGNKSETASDRYGSNGYVVFADYKGTAMDGSKRSEVFSPFNAGEVRNSQTGVGNNQSTISGGNVINNSSDQPIGYRYTIVKTTTSYKGATATVDTTYDMVQLDEPVENKYLVVRTNITDNTPKGGTKIVETYTEQNEDNSGYRYVRRYTKKTYTVAGVETINNDNELKTDTKTATMQDIPRQVYYTKETTYYNTSKNGDVSSIVVETTIVEMNFNDNWPYVTSSPKTDITPSQFLTSDGVSNTSYYGSAAQAIVQGINTNKGYSGTGISNLATLRTSLTSNMSSIKSVVTSSSSYGGYDFPVLVIDDLSTANDLVNNYLKLLTNTNYNFYNGYDDGTTTYLGTDRTVYNVDISKWKYDSTSGKFVKQAGAASLKCDVNDRFYITPTEVDNENWQFSLIDVQFYDPTAAPTFNNNNVITKAGSIAYHLYVPVVVKKMLHYTVQIRQASTTSYNLNAYPTEVANLVENLGNPVTMKVTYTYWQTAPNWADAINGGESVYRNYDKILELKSWGDLFPSDASIVMVDPNDNADKYYTDSLTNVLTDGTVIDEGTKTYKLNLNSFSGFSVVKLNDLMTISLDTTATTKNLVEWVEGTDSADSIVAVVNDGGENNGLKLRYKTGNETGTYAVNVELKDYQNNSDYVQENYYISIFTKEGTDNNIYHYQTSSSGSNFGDSSYPSARIGTAETPHLFLGNIYTNDIRISETNSDQLMSESNLSLTADLTATVGFTKNAVDSSIASFINNDNVHIYQTFMVSLNRLNGETNQRGILVNPAIVYPSSYQINGATPTTYYGLDYNISPSYIELTNDCNIKSDLQYAANHPKTVDGVKDYTISITESVSMTYALSSLSTQFPQATASTATNSEQSTIGTYMIGYSNMSSTSDGGAASRASANTDGTKRLCYYIADDTSVDFSYNAVHNNDFDGDGNGNYGQLGLDGKELDGDGKSYVQINSAARYNTHDYNLKSSGKFVKITVKLSKKGESGETAPYTTALKISDYLTGFEILDKNGDAFETTADDPATTDVDESVTVITNSDDNIYTYIVPKDMLDTLSDDEYYIPINFKAYSGNNATFEDKNMQYSNYKVLVTVGLLTSNSTTEAMLQNSDGTDHIIYTNAKIHSEVID